MTRNAAGFAVKIIDESDQTAEVALQGPSAAAILQKISAGKQPEIGYYEFLPQWQIAGVSTLVSRTGYTGEDGFEIYFAVEDVSTVWDALLEAGKEYGLQPAGLGCRDTLRFAASMPL